MTLKLSHLAACAALGTAASLITTDEAHAGCNPEYSYIGDICITGANYCPAGTAQAKGQLLEIAANPELFAVYSNFYGGDGSKTFALPNLAMRSPVGVGQFVPAPYSGGSYGGQVGVNLGRVYVNQNENQLANHTHTATVSSEAATTAPHAHMAPNPDKQTVAEEQSSPEETTTVTIAPAGFGSDMAVVGPRLTVNYCVIMEGDFPPRYEEDAKEPSE